MTKKTVIKPAISQKFQEFLKNERILFFSAPCGFGKTVVAQALLEGRGYTTPQDVKSVAYDVLRHRITLTYEAEAEEMRTEDIIRRVLETVPVP